VGLERGPLSLVSTTEELLGRKSSGSCLENREYGRRDPSRGPRGTLCPQKSAITSPTSGGRSVGIIRSRSFSLVFFSSGTTLPLLPLSPVFWKEDTYCRCRVCCIPAPYIWNVSVWRMAILLLFTFRVFNQVLQASSGTVTEARQRRLVSKLFSIHYSSIILPSGTVQSDLQTGYLNKQEINT
jgi:hypothetical protein